MRLMLKKKRLRPLTECLNWDNSDLNTNGELFILQTLGADWELCFDIGANRGEYTELLKKYSPLSKIVSFEPNPKSAKYIKTNRRVKKEILAIGDKQGTVVINFNTEDDTQSSTYRKNENTTPVEVEQVSLDDYIKRNKIKRIDFMKIDTEGHELAVIKGAKHIIENQMVDFIQFEYGGTYPDAGITLATVYRKLAPYYIVCHILPKGILPVEWSEELETYRYSNWLAVSRKAYKN